MISKSLALDSSGVLHVASFSALVISRWEETTRHRLFGAKDTDLFFFVLVGSFKFFIDDLKELLRAIPVTFRPRKSESMLFGGEEERPVLGMSILIMW